MSVPTRFSMWCALTHGHVPTAADDGNYVTHQEYERDMQAKDRTIERLKEALESIATKCLCGWEPPPDNCPCLSCTARKALQEPT